MALQLNFLVLFSISGICMKKFLHIFIYIYTLYGCNVYPSEPSLDDAYKAIDIGQLSQAENIANKLRETKYGDVSLLKGWVFFKKEKFNKAINEVSNYIIKNKELADAHAVSVYYEMILLAGAASYKLDDCENSIKYLKPYLSENLSEDNKLIPYMSMVAICYYKQKLFDKSLDYFKYLYSNVDDNVGKEEAIYNIAALYSLLGDTVNSVKWLKMIRNSIEINWIDKTRKDSDFNYIHESIEYKNL